MASRSNRFCAWTGADCMHASRAATAIDKTDNRKFPTSRSVKMDRYDMSDCCGDEKKEERHMQHMP